MCFSGSGGMEASLGRTARATEAKDLDQWPHSARQEVS